jgi:hypothetical protein
MARQPLNVSSKGNRARRCRRFEKVTLPLKDMAGHELTVYNANICSRSIQSNFPL